MDQSYLVADIKPRGLNIRSNKVAGCLAEDWAFF
jgi:hypothetical protein